MVEAVVQPHGFEPHRVLAGPHVFLLALVFCGAAGCSWVYSDATPSDCEALIAQEFGGALDGTVWGQSGVVRGGDDELLLDDVAAVFSLSAHELEGLVLEARFAGMTWTGSDSELGLELWNEGDPENFVEVRVKSGSVSFFAAPALSGVAADFDIAQRAPFSVRVEVSDGLVSFFAESQSESTQLENQSAGDLGYSGIVQVWTSSEDAIEAQLSSLTLQRCPS